MTDSLTHLAGRVWFHPHDPDPERVRPGVTVIADPRGSVIVDAGQSPGHALRVQDAIRAAGLPSPRWLVYTHHHWDHTWGACAWPGVEIVGHTAGSALLEAEARRPWSTEYLHAQVEADPRLGSSFRARERAMPTWERFAVVPPHRTFDDALVLPTGVELRHVGGRHAEDSTVVTVPDSGVLLLGDSFYPPPFHLRQPGDDLDLDLVRSLISDDVQWYVDSHSNPRSLAEVRAAVEHGT